MFNRIAVISRDELPMRLARVGCELTGTPRPRAAELRPCPIAAVERGMEPAGRT